MRGSIQGRKSAKVSICGEGWPDGVYGGGAEEQGVVSQNIGPTTEMKSEKMVAIDGYVSRDGDLSGGQQGWGPLRRSQPEWEPLFRSSCAERHGWSEDELGLVFKSRHEASLRRQGHGLPTWSWAACAHPQGAALVLVWYTHSPSAWLTFPEAMCRAGVQPASLASS